MSLKTKRLHDKIYLKENKYNNPKESFKLLIKILKKRYKNKNFKLLDVGCANGELLYNLKKNFKKAELTGIDINKLLLKKAKKNCGKNINFYKKNISKKNLKIGKFDVVIASGVVSIFDNPKLILRNLLINLKPKGEIYIFNSLNEHPFNIYIKYEDLFKNKNILQSGQNIFSIKFYKDFFKNKRIEMIPFFIKKRIKKNRKDLIRSWTVKSKGKNIFTNALGFLQNQYWIRIY
tara:strand:- start:1794 stop:2495 length:702 start_codon:yes stop_codon:yes gene_type:complete